MEHFHTIYPQCLVYTVRKVKAGEADSLQCKHAEPHLLLVSIRHSQSSLLLGSSALNYPLLQFCSPSHRCDVRAGA